MNFTEAVFVRRSVRKYREEALDPFVLEGIQAYVQKIPPLKPGIGVGFYLHDNLESNMRIKGMFLADAPYYLIFSSELREDYLLNAGYMLQQAVLYLTAKGIASCYQGGFKPDAYIKSKLSHSYTAAIAFGLAKGETYRKPEKAKRLRIEQIAAFKEDVGEDMHKLLAAGMAAPSSFNNQPWRMAVYRNKIHIFCKKGYFKKDMISDVKLIDMGILLANLAVAADEGWMNMEIVQLPQMKERQMKNVEYIASLLQKEEQGS